MSSEDVVASMMLEFDEDLRKKAKTLSIQHTSESIIFLFTQFNLWAFTSYFKFKHNTMGHFV